MVDYHSFQQEKKKKNWDSYIFRDEENQDSITGTKTLTDTFNQLREEKTKAGDFERGKLGERW